MVRHPEALAIANIAYTSYAVFALGTAYVTAILLAWPVELVWISVLAA